MIGGLELSPFLAVSAFVVAVVVVAGFLTDRLRLPVDPTSGWADSTRGVLVSPLSLAAWPLVLFLVAFATSGATNLLWVMGVGAIVVGLGVGSLLLLRRVHRERGDVHVSGSTVGTTVAALTLLEFHWLMTVRLAVVPDPTAPLVAGLAPSALQAGSNGVLLPAAAIATIIAAVGNFSRIPGFRGRVPRPPAWLRSYGAPALIFLLFVLPVVPGLGGLGKLTFLGLATPEYGKVVYLWLLALVITKYVVSAGTTGAGAVPFYRDKRVAYPTGLFLLVAIASVIRFDLGQLVPVFVGTLAMSWCALRDEAARRVPPGPPSEERQAAARDARTIFRRDLAIPLLVTAIFAGAALNTDYVQVRLEVHGEAWQYNWNVDCVPPPEGMALPSDLPPGAGACLRNLQDAEASQRSQIARAGAVIADGGLWGRGLGDTASGRVPLAATDFALAAAWSKLGGLTVLGYGLLLTLLAAALNRAVWDRRRRVQRTSTLLPPADRSRLFAAGLGAMILGQFLFVLAATLNWIPHSGITAPLLSRGGQSTLALAGGLVITLAVAYHDSSTPRSHQPAQGSSSGRGGGTPPARPNLRGAGVVALIAVLGLVVPTVWPYGGYPENRPLCGTRPAVVNPEKCSTDLVAYSRTKLEIRLPDGRVLARNQNQAAWTWADGSGKETTGLGGLISAPGQAQGLVEAALPNVLRSSLPTSLVSRMLPHVTGGQADGYAAVTLVPELQTAAANALAADPESAGVPVLAGGLVILDAQTGHLLAAASAPGIVPASPDDADASEGITDEQRRAFDSRHSYGVLSGTTLTELGAEDRTCKVAARIEDNKKECNQWMPTAASEEMLERQRAENDRYVGGGPDVTVPPEIKRPDPQVNRALGRAYGVGSTFKVVVAAAFLRGDPAAGSQTMIEAPLKVDVGNGVTVRNHGDDADGPQAPGQACPGSAEGRISLQRALAVSCNTAFVALAQRIGWDAVRNMATELGFGIGGTEKSAALAASTLDQESVVPQQARGSAIGNLALGGGDIQATPLQMASVMATIANGGHHIQPSIATEVREPGGQTQMVRPSVSDPFSPAVADRLTTALSETASDCRGCTARNLVAPAGTTLWVKTGTHVVYADQAVPKDAYAVEYAWIAGFMNTTDGPVSFAVALEAGKGDGSGGARAREVLHNVLDVVAKERG